MTEKQKVNILKRERILVQMELYIHIASVMIFAYLTYVQTAHLLFTITLGLVMCAYANYKIFMNTPLTVMFMLLSLVFMYNACNLYENPIVAVVLLIAYIYIFLIDDEIGLFSDGSTCGFYEVKGNMKSMIKMLLVYTSFALAIYMIQENWVQVIEYDWLNILLNFVKIMCMIVLMVVSVAFIVFIHRGIVVEKETTCVYHKDENQNDFLMLQRIIDIFDSEDSNIFSKFFNASKNIIFGQIGMTIKIAKRLIFLSIILMLVASVFFSVQPVLKFMSLVITQVMIFAITNAFYHAVFMKNKVDINANENNLIGWDDNKVNIFLACERHLLVVDSIFVGRVVIMICQFWTIFLIVFGLKFAIEHFGLIKYTDDAMFYIKKLEINIASLFKPVFDIIKSFLTYGQRT